MQSIVDQNVVMQRMTVFDGSCVSQHTGWEAMFWMDSNLQIRFIPIYSTLVQYIGINFIYVLLIARKMV